MRACLKHAVKKSDRDCCCSAILLLDLLSIHGGHFLIEYVIGSSLQYKHGGSRQARYNKNKIFNAKPPFFGVRHSNGFSRELIPEFFMAKLYTVASCTGRQNSNFFM
jgi:hypothetical protein